MSENSCCDLKTGRFWLVRRSLGKGGWLFFRALSRHSRKATPDQTTIFIPSTIFFQSNFAGLLKLPLFLFYSVNRIRELPITFTGDYALFWGRTASRTASSPYFSLNAIMTVFNFRICQRPITRNGSSMRK